MVLIRKTVVGASLRNRVGVPPAFVGAILALRQHHARLQRGHRVGHFQESGFDA